MKQTIGFTRVYYTLWHVSVEKHWVDAYSFTYRTHYQYIQNLSMDLEEAKKKIDGEYDIDLELRGESDFYRNFGDVEYDREKIEGTSVFLFGKYRAQLFEEIDDPDYLLWYFFENVGTAKEQPKLTELLMERGEIVEKDGEYFTPDALEKKEREEKLQYGFHEQDGERVELTIQWHDEFGFEGNYGYTTIQTFIDPDYRVFKYIGSSPVRIQYGEQLKVKATIQHQEYRGQAETRIKRVSVIDTDNQ